MLLQNTTAAVDTVRVFLSFQEENNNNNKAKHNTLTKVTKEGEHILLYTIST